MSVDRCGKTMRGGTCQLDPGHGGSRHSTVVHYCDGCGKYRRGSRPHAVAQTLMPDGCYEVHAQFCFLCVKDERTY